MLLESRCYPVSSAKSTALSQDSDVEEKQASFTALKDQQQQQQQQPLGGSIYKKETTQANKGPVCRQQAELTELPLGSNRMVLGTRECYHCSFKVTQSCM